MQILCLDSGSSSLKYAIYAMPSEQLLASGVAEVSSAGDQSRTLLGVLQDARRQGIRIDAAGHRVVFGGPDHVAPQLVDSNLLASLEVLASADRVHMPPALGVMRSVAQHLPDVRAIACFDSAFHHAMPALAKRYALPSGLGPMIRRYGYHGLSYEYVVASLKPQGRTIIAHLGNGASLAAVNDGAPVETTMGFSPLGGVVMGTRPGDLDPGVLLYLLRAKRLSVDDLTLLLNFRSGLLGVSGSTYDMRELLAQSHGNAAAREAIDLFVYTIVKHIGALTAALGGLDQLIFTGGIGEHAAPIRRAVCVGCAYLGVQVDERLNEAHAPAISTPASRIRAMVVATNENLMIARHAFRLLS